MLLFLFKKLWSTLKVFDFHNKEKYKCKILSTTTVGA
jgi:hypothetical protein